MDKLRLLITDKCDRRCRGCCNNDWDLDKLPIIDSYEGYNEIILTGGEPLLSPAKVISCVYAISNANPFAKIYLYTAKSDPTKDFIRMMDILDGICLTIHRQEDVNPFYCLDRKLDDLPQYHNVSLRLNIFKGINVFVTNRWVVKKDIEWIKNCPLPENEVFMRLKGGKDG